MVRVSHVFIIRFIKNNKYVVRDPFIMVSNSFFLLFVPVGLFGFAMKIIFVLSVIASAIASRSWV